MYNPKLEKRKTIRNVEKDLKTIDRISRISREENSQSMKQSKLNNRIDDIQDRPRSKGIKYIISSPLRITFTNHSIQF